MTTTNVFADVVNAQVRAVFDQRKETILSELVGFEMVTEYSPDALNEQVSGIASPSYGVLTVEGMPYAANQLYRDYPVTVVPRKYTSQLTYTKEDVYFLQKQRQTGNTGRYEQRITEIASSGVDPIMGNMNKDLAKMFYLGFGTTFFTGGDAVALFASNHPIRKTGGTQSNILTNEYTLTANSLDLAITQMNRFKSPSDVQMRKVRRLRIVCSVALESTARQIITSLYGPGNGNLGLQKSSSQALANRGIDIDVVVLPEIGTSYDAYWWLVDLDRAANRFLFCKAWGPDMNPQTDYTNGTYTINADALFTPTSLGWQWAIGSRGTGGAV